MIRSLVSFVLLFSALSHAKVFGPNQGTGKIFSQAPDTSQFALSGDNTDLTSLRGLSDGTAGSPVLAPSTGTDNGIYFDGANDRTLISAAGTERLRVHSTGVTVTGTLGATNLSGTNTGDVTIGTGNGLSLVNQVLSLAAAGASDAGAVTTGAQTIAGLKTFSTAPVISPLTASRVIVTDTNSGLAASSVSTTTLGFLDASSSIQTQLNAKAPLASPTFSGTITTALTASRALVTGSSSELAVSATTSTQIGYLSTLSSNAQTQIDAKAPIASPTFTGQVVISESSAASPVIIKSLSGNSSGLKISANSVTDDASILNHYAASLFLGSNNANIVELTTGGGTKLLNLTASTVPYLDASKVLTSSAVTPTALGYISTLSSNAQTQIDAKAPIASPTFTGTISLEAGAGSDTYVRLRGNNTTSGANQYGLYVDSIFSSSSTSTGYGITSSPATVAASFTQAHQASFVAAASIGAGSTITRHSDYYTTLPTVGTYNAAITDNSTYTANYFIHSTSTRPSLLSGNLSIVGSDNLPFSVTGTSSAGTVRFLNPAASGKYNWLVGGQYNVNNGFEITASSATDGSTFSTPLFQLSNTGTYVFGASGGTSVNTMYARALDVQSSNSGVVNYLQVQNTSNTSGSDAQLGAVVGGSSGGDAYTFYGGAGNSWLTGMDNSDSDAYKISLTGLGTSDWLRISTGGAVTLGGSAASTLGTWNTDNLAVIGSSSTQESTVYRGGVDTANLRLLGGATNTGGMIRLYGASHASAPSETRFYNNNTLTGLIDVNGAWDIGIAGQTTLLRGITTVRRDQNARTRLFVRNDNTSSNATAEVTLQLDSGDVNLYGQSLAGGAAAVLGVDGTFTGGFVLNQLGSNPISIRTNSTERISVAGTGLVTVTGNLHVNGVITGGFAEVDDGNSSTADTIDWTTGSAHKSTLTGNVTYTFTAPSQAGTPLVLRILTGAGSYTATWPASVKWAGGTAPTITTTASRMDLVNFYYDGTNYYGSYTQNYTP